MNASMSDIVISYKMIYELHKNISTEDNRVFLERAEKAFKTLSDSHRRRMYDIGGEHNVYDPYDCPSPGKSSSMCNRHKELSSKLYLGQGCSFQDQANNIDCKNSYERREEARGVFQDSLGVTEVSPQQYHLLFSVKHPTIVLYYHSDMMYTKIKKVYEYVGVMYQSLFTILALDCKYHLDTCTILEIQTTPVIFIYSPVRSSEGLVLYNNIPYKKISNHILSYMISFLEFVNDRESLVSVFDSSKQQNMIVVVYVTERVSDIPWKIHCVAMDSMNQRYAFRLISPNNTEVWGALGSNVTSNSLLWVEDARDLKVRKCQRASSRRLIQECLSQFAGLGNKKKREAVRYPFTLTKKETKGGVCGHQHDKLCLIAVYRKERDRKKFFDMMNAIIDYKSAVDRFVVPRRFFRTASCKGKAWFEDGGILFVDGVRKKFMDMSHFENSMEGIGEGINSYMEQKVEGTRMDEQLMRCIAGYN